MSNMLFEASEWWSHPDRILAVVGGAAVVGFGLPWLVQMAVRGWTGQQVPRWIVMSLRVVSGGASGWLVALWLFSSGSGGLGGSGGFGFGTGDNKVSNNVDSSQRKEDPVHRQNDLTRPENMLVVEVLGSATLEEINNGKSFDKERCYRLQTPEGPSLKTLKEVEDYLKQRAKEKPPLNGVKIVLYKDSPSKYVPLVDKLAEYAEGLRSEGNNEQLTVSYSQPDGNAPK